MVFITDKMAVIEMNGEEATRLDRFIRLLLIFFSVNMITNPTNQFFVFIAGFYIVELHLKIVLSIFPDTTLTRIIPCFLLGPSFNIGIFWAGFVLTFATHVFGSFSSLLKELE